MDSSFIFPNVLNSPVLFFFTGMTAIALKAELESLNPIPLLFSLGFLFTVGLNGAHELHNIGVTPDMAQGPMVTVELATFVSVVIYSFFILRLKPELYNAAEVSAAYGSIRAVTLVTASSGLSGVNVDSCSPVVAALALMESPAIIVNLLLRLLRARVFAHRHDSQKSQETFGWGNGLQKSCLDGSVFLSIGSLLVGQVWPGPLNFRFTSPSAFQVTFN